MQADRHLSLTISGYKILPVPTGLFGLDGGAMFGTVPKVIWEKTNPPDEKNRISMEARALLLKCETRCILVDTGNGEFFVEKYGDKIGGKFKDMYGVQSSEVSLKRSLKNYGLSPDDITDVILTHLHFDHAGGGVEFQDSKLVPTFKNAKYYVQKTNLETATHPNVREKASYLPANFRPLIDAKVLNIIEGELEIAPGVSVIISNGHTRGQQLVKVEDENHVLVYCGDLIPTSSHIRLPFVMGYDLDPLLIIEEKQKLLSEAVRLKKDFYLYFEHDPYFELATVEAKGTDFQLKERIRLTN